MKMKKELRSFPHGAYMRGRAGDAEGSAAHANLQHHHLRIRSTADLLDVVEGRRRGTSHRYG